MKKESSHKYVELWKSVLPEILCFLADEENEEMKLTLKKELFSEVGNRIHSGYTFRLDIQDGYVPTKEGSAVARDLKIVLDESERFREYAINKDIIIRLDSKFVLHIVINYHD